MSRTLSSAIAAEEARGVRDAHDYTRGALTLRSADMGAFSSGARWSSLALRRLLLRLHVPPGWVAGLRPLAVRRGRTDTFDRFVKRYAYWRGVRRGLGNRRAWSGLLHAPVVLMYHAVGGPAEPPSCYVVPRARFGWQLAWLRLARYRIIALGDLVACLRENRIAPARSVVLTFDDGFLDNHAEALPLLRRARARATVFMVVDAIGGTAWWPSDRALARRKLMSAGHLADLQAAGIEIGAHTLTHPALTSLDPKQRDEEIAGARARLAERLGSPVRTFAYPFGDCSPAVRDAVERAGFDAACCSRAGFADPAAPLHELPRVEVRGTDSLFAFTLMLRRGHRKPGAATTKVLAEAAV